MKSLVLCAFVAAAGVVVNALVAPKIDQKAEDVKLLRYESNNDGLGTYRFAYDQSDSSKRNKEGELKNAGTDNAFVAVKGSFTWKAPDNSYHTINYVADENGYHPSIETGLVGTPPPEIAALYGF